MIIEITEHKLLSIARKIVFALGEKANGIVSAENSSDPVQGAGQIIRGDATAKGIMSALYAFGIDTTISKDSITLSAINTGEVLITMKR